MMRWRTRILMLSFLAAGAGMLCAAPPSGSHGGGHANAGPYAPLGSPRNFPTSLGLGPSFGFTGINPGALNSRGGYGRGYSRRLPGNYFFAPYYYPSLAYGDSGYEGGGYDAAASYQGPDPVAQGLMQGQDALGAQVAQLQEQVANLGYAQQTPLPPGALANPSSPAEPPQPPVTLVLRSGKQLRIQNFAVMDQTFWDFSSQPARKIPLNAIDIPASTQATEAQGGEFPSLTGGE